MGNFESKDVTVGTELMASTYSEAPILRRAKEMVEGVSVYDDFETKVSFVGQLKFQQGEFRETVAAYEVSVFVGDVLDFVKMPRAEVYREMIKLQNRMNSRIFSFIDPVSGEIATRSLVIGTNYLNGEFKIQYHKEMKEILLAEKGYAPLLVETYKGLQRTSSCNLYEHLKVKFYKKNDRCIRDGRFVKKMSIEELRVRLGTVKITEELQRELDKTKVDWAYIIKHSPNVSNFDYSKFKKRVLQVAVDEVLKESEFDELDYDELKKGHGGKVYEIEFRWHDTLLDETTEEDKIVRPEGVDTVVEGSGVDASLVTKVKDGREMGIYLSCISIFEGLKTLEGDDLVDYNFAQQLCETCGCDMGALEQLRKFYESSDPSKIPNRRGWLVSCLRGGWYKKSKANSKVGGGSAGSFGNFQKRDIDFDALTAKVFAHQMEGIKKEPKKPDIVVDAVEIVDEAAGGTGDNKSSYIEFDEENVVEFNEEAVIRQLEYEQQESVVPFDDDWDFEPLPNGNLMYNGYELDCDVAREQCPLSKTMIRRLKGKYGLMPTEVDYSCPQEVVEHIGGSIEDYGSDVYSGAVIDFINSLYGMAKRQNGLIEYAIELAKEKGYVFTGRDDAKDRGYMMFVKSTVNKAINWAFDNIC